MSASSVLNMQDRVQAALLQIDNGTPYCIKNQWSLSVILLIMIAPLTISTLLGWMVYDMLHNDIDNTFGILTLLGATMFLLITYWLVFPQRMELHPDKLRICCGWPVRYSVAYQTIESLDRVRGCGQFMVATTGVCVIKLATSFDALYMHRDACCDFVISPKEPDFTHALLAQLVSRFRVMSTIEENYQSYITVEMQVAKQSKLDSLPLECPQ
eukprot:g56254.t1